MPVVALLGECDYNRSLFGFMPGSIAWCKMIPLLVVTYPPWINPKNLIFCNISRVSNFLYGKKLLGDSSILNIRNAPIIPFKLFRISPIRLPTLPRYNLIFTSAIRVTVTLCGGTHFGATLFAPSYRCICGHLVTALHTKRFWSLTALLGLLISGLLTI